MRPLEARSPLADEAPTRFTVPAALDYAAALTQSAPRPGEGRTRDLWQLFAALGATDLQLARAVEPHLDAVAILAQAGVLDEVPRGSTHDGWRLEGVKPWCSLAGSLSAALVTAHVDGGRRLFAVDLEHPSAVADEGAWVARGLVDIPSGPVRFTNAPAVPIGDTDWYLQRPGFAWGGIGVAACWFGGAVGLARSVHAAADAENPLLAMHLGAIDAALHAAGLALASAADDVDAGRATGPDGSLLAKRVRAIVASACETVLARAGHALGPAPLALDAEHAQRVADLTLYVRQHHAERDLASLGATVAAIDRPW